LVLFSYVSECDRNNLQNLLKLVPGSSFASWDGRLDCSHATVAKA